MRWANSKGSTDEEKRNQWDERLLIKVNKEISICWLDEQVRCATTDRSKERAANITNKWNEWLLIGINNVISGCWSDEQVRCATTDRSKERAANITNKWNERLLIGVNKEISSCWSDEQVIWATTDLSKQRDQRLMIIRTYCKRRAATLLNHWERRQLIRDLRVCSTHQRSSLHVRSVATIIRLISRASDHRVSEGLSATDQQSYWS